MGIVGTDGQLKSKIQSKQRPGGFALHI